MVIQSGLLHLIEGELLLVIWRVGLAPHICRGLECAEATVGDNLGDLVERGSFWGWSEAHVCRDMRSDRQDVDYLRRVSHLGDLAR